MILKNAETSPFDWDIAANFAIPAFNKTCAAVTKATLNNKRPSVINLAKVICITVKGFLNNNHM